MTGCDVAIYNGTFPTMFLHPGEAIRATGDGTGACTITTPAGRELTVPVGTAVVRTPDGTLHNATIHTDHHIEIGQPS